MSYAGNESYGDEDEIRAAREETKRLREEDRADHWKDDEDQTQHGG